MGIGGSGVSGVSILAYKEGFKVSGCDLERQTAYLPKVRKYISDIYVGHDMGHLGGVDLVVVSPAVFFQNKTHPELLKAQKEKKVLTWQEFLGKYLHKDKRVICVTGTHGKSTVTAITSLLFEDAGLNPSATVGATLREWGENVRHGAGKFFITEADEFCDNFLNYRPMITIITNIEFDHPDFFRSEKHLLQSFAKFVKNLKGERILIVNQDSYGIKKLFTLLGEEFLTKLKIFGYSMGSPLINVPHSLMAEGIKRTKSGTKFRAKSASLNINRVFSLKIPGLYNVSNALGVIILSKIIGIRDEILVKSLDSYSGIGRRLELLGEKRGIGVWDDYAHHPTAIKATLSGLRQFYPKNRIWAVIEAHSYSRTKVLLKNYRGVFSDADEVIVGPIFRARDAETFGISEESIVRASEKKNARAIKSLTGIIKTLKEETRKGDIVLVMGAGKSYDWSRRILKSL